MSDEYLDFYTNLHTNLCTSFVLSSDLVQRLPLRSITIWQSIFSTSYLLCFLSQFNMSAVFDRPDKLLSYFLVWYTD